MYLILRKLIQTYNDNNINNNMKYNYIKIIKSNKIIIYNLLFNSNKLKYSFNIINNILIINNKDLDNVIKILDKSYYTQTTYKLIK